jgi:hypothetical protein
VSGILTVAVANLDVIVPEAHAELRTVPARLEDVARVLRFAARMSKHDVRLLAALRGGPWSRSASSPRIDLHRLSTTARAQLEELIVHMEERLSDSGAPICGVRQDVYEMLGIAAMRERPAVML